MKKTIVCVSLIIIICTGMIVGNCNKLVNAKKSSDVKILVKAQNAEEGFISKGSSSNNYVILNDFENENNQRNKVNPIDFISELTQSTNKKITDNEDVLLLARLIESEAGNQSYVGKLAVASVVINRSKTESENVSEVIYKNNQFDGVGTENFNIQPGSESINAAREVLSGENIITEAYYYANLNLCSPDFANQKKFIERIGDHWFFKK